MNLNAKEKLQISIDTLRKYNLNGSESIIESLSLILRGMEEAETEVSNTAIKKERFHIILKDRNNKRISKSANPKTLEMAVLLAGLSKVRDLNIKFFDHPFITDAPTKNDKNKYRLIGDNLYIRKIDSAKLMEPILQQINESLNLGWTIILK